DVRGWARVARARAPAEAEAFLPLELSIRRAISADVEALRALIRESVLGLSAGDYSKDQLASALTHLFGVDTRLIDDGTYFVVEESGSAAPVACGGWSRRR